MWSGFPWRFSPSADDWRRLLYQGTKELVITQKSPDKREELLLPLLIPEVDVKVILALVRCSHLAFEGKMKYAFNRRARERE